MTEFFSLYSEKKKQRKKKKKKKKKQKKECSCTHRHPPRIIINALKISNDFPYQALKRKFLHQKICRPLIFVNFPLPLCVKQLQRMYYCVFLIFNVQVFCFSFFLSFFLFFNFSNGNQTQTKRKPQN